MAGFHKTIVCGRVGREVESRTVGDTDVANFSVAVSESYKDKQGNKQEKTTWYNVQLWRGLAKVASQYVKKGDMVLIEGRISTREYEDKQGAKRQSWDLIGDNMQMLGGKGEANAQPQERPSMAIADDEPDSLPF